MTKSDLQCLTEYQPRNFVQYHEEEYKYYDEPSSRRSSSNSFLQQTGVSFMDDSDILRQVREADSLLGGIDNNIFNEKTSPIMDDLKVSKTSIKVRSVRRSSRLFRNKQTLSEKENSEESVGSIFTEVVCHGTLKRSRYGAKSLRV